MLTKYFTSAISVCLAIIIFSIFAKYPKRRHLIIWFPVVLLSAALAIIWYVLPQLFNKYKSLGEMWRDSMVPVIYYLFLKPFFSGAVYALPICIVLSLLLWFIAAHEYMQETRHRSNILCIIFTVLLFVSIADRLFIILPELSFKQTNGSENYIEQTGGSSYYSHGGRPNNDVNIIENEDYSYTFSSDVYVYASSDKNSGSVAVISKGTTVSAYEQLIENSYPTPEKGWRYSRIYSGYIRTNELLCAVSKQSSLARSQFARYELLSMDVYAFDHGNYLSHDYYRAFYPAETYLFALCLIATIMARAINTLKSKHRVH